ncbi:hypothetical protein MTO96_019817 [Rhipicephalus appendiculatus]
MENLSAEQEQTSLAALPEKVDNTSFFDRREAENFRLPCTAATPTITDNDQRCPINDYLPICNELLFDVGMELREERGGLLSLVYIQPRDPVVMPPRDVDLHRSNAFLRWLLRTHVCIACLRLQYEWVTAHSRVILDELPEKSRLKKLELRFPYRGTVQSDFATLLPRLRYLEELHCYMPQNADVFVAAASTLLRTTTCLTSLVFDACSGDSQPPKVFIDALAANTTLTSLEMWANWSTDEPPGTLGEYVRSNGLLTNLRLFRRRNGSRRAATRRGPRS